MEKTIRRICCNTIAALLLTAMVTTTVAPTSNSDAYPTPENNPSKVAAAELTAAQNNTPVETEATETTEATTAPTETEPVETIPETIPETVPETVPETEPVPEETAPPYIWYFDDNDVLAMARTLWNECRGIKSKTHQACVAWTACNRVGKDDWGDTIIEVLTYPNAFAHTWSAPIDDELYALALDVLTRWNDERNGFTNVGRVLPDDYLYFHGDGRENYFRRHYENDYDYWDYSLPSPYEN